MNVAKGLVIREPWIDLILSGEKSWEMRSTRISFRGWIGMIRKGSGLVSGIARIEGIGHALSALEMMETFDKHRIPQELILQRRCCEMEYALEAHAGARFAATSSLSAPQWRHHPIHS